MSVKESILLCLADRKAVIGVVGLGYVGLPLALRYAEAGYSILGFDIDPDKPHLLAQGRSYYRHIADSRVKAASRSSASAA